MRPSFASSPQPRLARSTRSPQQMMDSVLSVSQPISLYPPTRCRTLIVRCRSAAAVDAAGLADTLDGDGTFTVFAPPDSAFSKLPEDLVTKLLDPTWSPQLNDLLLYHVLGSEVLSTDLAEGLMAPTLDFQGDEITVSLDPPSIDESVILVDDGLVDIEASNGVVHAIDSVLTPPSISNNIVDVAAGNDDFSTLVAALSAAGLVDALSGEGPFTVFGNSFSSVLRTVL